MTKDQLKQLETDLWAAADNLRGNSDLKSSQYSTPVLGLIFLRFADNNYRRHEAAIHDEYRKLKGTRRERKISEIAIERCGFYLPDNARYDYLLNLPEREDIAAALKEAMRDIEKYIGFSARRDDSDVRFIKYCLDTYKRQMQAISQGTTQDNLSQGKLLSLRFRIPDFTTQRKVAAILAAYDDLIEANQRRIALLERMAEEIYREWFVRLRFPGHEKTKIIKGVPQGWDILPFSETVSINPVERIDKNEDRPFVGMEDLSVSSMYFTSKERRNGHVGPKFRNGDVLFPRITPSVENGKRGLVMTLADGEVAQGSTEFIVFREGRISSEHIYFLSCSEGFRTNAELSMTGASGRQRVQEECFRSFLVKAPPAPVRQLFVNVVRPMVSQIRALALQIETLTRTRDLLLPRLISGKLRVDDLAIQFPPSMAADNQPPTPSAAAR